MADLPNLSGPSVLPEGGKAPEQIVLLLHGVGSDGQDLLGLAPYYQKVARNAVFIAPNGPQPFDGGPPELPPTGYQWFSLSEGDPQRRFEGMKATAPIIDAYIDQLLAEYKLDASKLVLVGFSQGTMMALHVGLRRAQPVAGIIGYCGTLIGGSSLSGEIKSRPPVLMVNGAVDAIMPPDVLEQSGKMLRENGVEVETMVRPNLGHGLDDEGVKAGMGFLAKVFDIDLQKLVYGVH